MTKHTVTLKLFQDDATGEYGFAHKNTIGADCSFNAFFTGVGIFHDVFEHWFEYEHKYFKGNYAMNVAGEMAANGACWYLYDTLGLHGYRELSKNSMFNFSENIRHNTESLIIESVKYGYCNFGYTLESCVPYQKPTNDAYLEDEIIQEQWKNIQDANPDLEHFTYKGNLDEDALLTAKTYKQSVTLSKIQNLHRYGYCMAKKLVPDNFENQQTLIKFIELFNAFCNNNNAQDLYNHFSGLTITVTKCKGLIKFKAVLNSSDCIMPDYKIVTSNTVDIYDMALL